MYFLITWHKISLYQKTTSLTHYPFIIPPPNIINQLMQFVKIGDLLSLKHQLNELVISEPCYQAFSKRINLLASEFRIAEIKKLLVTNLDKS